MQVDSVNALFAYGQVRFRSVALPQLKSPTLSEINNGFDARPSRQLLHETIRLRETLRDIRQSFRVLANRGVRSKGGVASIASASPLGLDAFKTPATLRSTAEINATPTSFTAFGPNLVGSTVTAPWSGPGSTAEATVSGIYDGSNGNNTLTFRVTRDGTHGQDDLKIAVLLPDETKIEEIKIEKEDPLHKTYTLANGLEITFGSGVLVKDEEFTVDTSLLSTSFGPTEPAWNGSTAAPTIGGAYDGSNGTGALTFRADRGGTHGEDDIKFKVYGPDDSFIQNIDVKKNDPLNKVYTLDNGLTLTFGAGDVIKNETFTIDVDAADPLGASPTQPQWIMSSAEFSVGGTYDGSNGTGTLTFRADDDGTHGVDDIKFKIYGPDGSFLQSVTVKHDDPLNQVYTLDNGLTFTLGAGDVIKNETLALELEAATSFATTPHPLESTAEVTIGGVYDGAQGTGTLSFQVVQGGTHGVDDLSLEVRGPDDTLLDTIAVAQTDPPDHVYQLSNGLTFQLGTGTLVANETVTINVNHQIGSRVDPDRPFDGTRNEIPNFEPGLGVTSGSFDINGVTISVSADDSITSVLEKINNSGSNVTAVFNVASETIDLTSSVAGAQSQIVLDNDSSGFLAATKLADAVVVPGRDKGTEDPINTIAALGAINSGQFSINGISISVDTATDSLNDVIDRINQSVPDVSVSYDVEDDVLRIQATPNTTVQLDDGSSGFFTALEIDPKAYEVRTRSGRLSSFSRRTVVRHLTDLTKAMNKLSVVAARSQNLSTGPDVMQRLWSGIESAIEPRLQESLQPPQGKLEMFGLTFNLKDADEFVSLDVDDISEAAWRHGRSFFDFFLDERHGSKPAGLFDELDSALRERERALFVTLAEAGEHVLDFYA